VCTKEHVFGSLNAGFNYRGLYGFWWCKLLMASYVVKFYLVRVGLFYLCTFCVVVVVMVEHFVEFVFGSWFVLFKFVLCFFWIWLWCLLFHGLCCRSLSCCFGLTLEMGSFVLLCLIYGLRFLIIICTFDLLGLFCLLVCDFSLRGRFCLILLVHCVESC